MRLLSHLQFVSVAIALTVVATAQDKPSQNNIKAREIFYASGRPSGPEQTSNRGGAGNSRSNSGTALSPLAFQYKVRKSNGKTFEEVDADTDFSSGDEIRIRVAVNDSAFVYIAQLGSSGAWKVLFPEAGAVNAGNVTAPFKDIEIPPGGDHAFEFDKRPGTEQLFIAVSRQPIANLEREIRNRNTQPPPASPAAKGRPDLVAASSTTPQFANAIVDEVLRSRDLSLVAFKADTPSGDSKEHAIYVANGTDSRKPVVAEFKLKHRP